MNLTAFFIAAAKDRFAGHFILSVSKAAHSMRDNMSELVLGEAGGNPIGEATFQFCD